MYPHSIYRHVILTTLATMGLLVIDRAIAQAQALPRLTPAQVHRFARDLNRSSSEDFFRQGKEQFEREVRMMIESRSQPKEDLLKINPSVQRQPDLSPLEQPATKSFPKP